MEIPANVPLQYIKEIQTRVGPIAIFCSDAICFRIHNAAVSCDLLFAINGEITNYPYAIMFYTPYLMKATPEMIEFTIQHEIGHLVNSHDFTATDVRKILRQECEADTYALLESRIGLIKAIKILILNHVSTVEQNKWNSDEIKLLNLELGSRLINLIKSIPLLIKSEIIRIKAVYD